MSKLTVIMSTYNENKEELNKSINSVLNQTFSNFKFIIIDDNPSSIMLKKYLLKKSFNDKRICLLFNKHNLGLVKSLNKGIRYSNSPLIARMDADDISTKNRFFSQLKFMDKYNLDLVFPNHVNIINNKLDKSSSFINEKIINQDLLKYFFCHYYNFSMHSGWLLKKEVYIKLNGYRNIHSVEDFDFLFRALVKGFKLGYQPNILMIIRRRFNGISGSSSLIQFISSLVLQNYVKETKYTRIIPINLVYIKLQESCTSKSVNKFTQFLKVKHEFKNHISVNNFLKFICSSLTSINAIKYLFKVQLIPLFNKKMYHKSLRRN